MPRDYYTRTGTEVATDVKRIFGDEALVELRDSDILRWINAAQREISTSHTVLKGKASHDLVAEQTLYTMPLDSPVAQVQGVHVDGKPLKGTSFQSAQETILRDDPEMKSSGEPRIWYEWDGDLYIHPAPAESKENGLELFYLAYPASLTGLSSNLTVPDRFYNQIVDYVLSQAYRLDENWQATAYQDARFRDSMNRHLAKEDIVDAQFYPTKVVLPEDE
jgi:hypothetical protein